MFKFWCVEWQYMPSFIFKGTTFYVIQYSLEFQSDQVSNPLSLFTIAATQFVKNLCEFCHKNVTILITPSCFAKNSGNFLQFL